MEILIGKKISALFVDKAGELAYLATDAGWVQLMPEGDCCAYSFIAEIVDADELIGGTVTSVEALEYLDNEIEHKRSVVDVFGYRLHTDKGSCVFSLRCKHNGYYSGWMTAFLSLTPEDMEALAPVTDGWNL